MPTQNPNELKPCPFCGNSAKITEIELNADTTRVKIVFVGCGVELNHTQEFYIHEKKDPISGELLDIVRIANNESAVEAWNRRCENG